MKLNLPAPVKRLRTTVATLAATAATTASRATGRGAGGMIGGLVAGAIDPAIMEGLGRGRPVTLITGTNGKSTTTRMLVAALRTRFDVVTNEGGDNMDAGIISALLSGRDASHIVLECDELHVPGVTRRLRTDCLVLLNLTRDQLDRVGEINSIERALRRCITDNPDMTVIANCDDVLMTSVAYDAANVVWVAAGNGWHGDSVSCPRTGGHIVRDGEDWYAVKPLADGREFRRPTPTWTITGDGLTGPDGGTLPVNLTLPGNANRGNAAQAIAAAAERYGVPVAEALPAVEAVDNVAGRYSTIRFEGRDVHMLLAKNPAGWQEALSMVDRSADGLVIAVNGQVADGEDLSWIWDVRFEDFGELSVVAAGERGTDLAVRLTYADIDHTLVGNTVDAIRACPEGRVEVLANYTAFRDLRRALTRFTEDQK
ncbi:MurT ligase domain-containing protein [Corynebacterium pygosceleis]|uniref:Lipid II isoglutaminyl synthase (glutamine-hydrolyzing) subunit MurT n=1 Tax=Corynebacterium pygosceleis TaxID=2800406 RepID=A0A9Q4GIE7_9CORY|nr:MurT ligase domain-containing protein [Corynebacterium pygosceleis]MCK7637339.1 MurT ligase domain-containing protein [Corynebacterium pygosceleis]MCK7675989.1 MurT ligase domain-containing protein [Corynebacterium pygosceleis]MCL0119885.1 MurT ligase domain-containing protein [Corynebacterium pygosceleis]MCX7445242.1 MurT ligase domain-containing protein [Corynebacterium pygosceleis]MCX7468333.1 MurT ligase domain-containing protein [Corynebacterium pygosceleis]